MPQHVEWYAPRFAVGGVGAGAGAGADCGGAVVDANDDAGDGPAVAIIECDGVAALELACSSSDHDLEEICRCEANLGDTKAVRILQ